MKNNRKPPKDIHTNYDEIYTFGISGEINNEISVNVLKSYLEKSMENSVYTYKRSYQLFEESNKR